MSRLLSLLLPLALAACASTPPDTVTAGCARGRPGSIEGEWALDRIDGVPWVVTQATLLAEPQGFAGTLACNGFGTSGPDDGSAHYAVDRRGRLALKGDVVKTTAWCGDRTLMAFEAAFVDVLYSRPHVARREGVMCLYTDDGRSLEFREAGTDGTEKEEP